MPSHHLLHTSQICRATTYYTNHKYTEPPSPFTSPSNQSPFCAHSSALAHKQCTPPSVLLHSSARARAAAHPSPLYRLPSYYTSCRFGANAIEENTDQLYRDRAWIRLSIEEMESVLPFQLHRCVHHCMHRCMHHAT